ncbi:MAG: TIGR03960 family B12-binding radical SAM protein [Firmicutes bacterium]|nr:TIGR03960 family B12-binding radical SAM protein [Bacillota bacterium]
MDNKQLILADILRRVEKPARYTGGEWNEVVKDHRATAVKMVLAFPDIYEVGMSHLGSHILYQVVNSRPDALLERVYAPWGDMEMELKQAGLPLFSLETKTPLKEFDLVGFTLQYEMTYTNILNMLALGNIPIRAAERDEGDPFVLAGGPCAYNVEPLAPFFDFVVLGEAEEVLGDIIDAFKDWRQKQGRRQDFLQDLVHIPGVYVPSLYDVRYRPDGSIEGVYPRQPDVPERVVKRVVRDLDRALFSTKPVVPYIDVVHNRAMIELFRGCARGCRFCQAGMIYRPVRERSRETLLKQAQELLASTGYDEISLSSLSSLDYSQIVQLIDDLVNSHGPAGVRVSLPSLRVDSFAVEQAQKIQQVRRSSVTFAPEAGSQRLRNVINKNVTEEDLLTAVRSAAEAGWRAFKLYFMIGLPTETDDDVLAIANLADKVANLSLSRGQITRVTVSTSNFVPKPHTPFQWEGQLPREELKRRQLLLNNKIRGRKLEHRWHAPEQSFLEAVFSKGDRRLADVLERAWQLGCRLDGWSEYFSFDRWEQAFADVGVDPAYWANRTIGIDEVLPWEHLDPGIKRDFLLAERMRGIQGKTTVDCSRDKCSGCGVCPTLEIPIRRRGEQE